MQDMQETPVRPRLGRSPEEGNGNPLQYSCLENSMDRGAWWATVHGVAKSQIELSPWFTILLGTGPDLALWGHLSPPLLSFFAFNLSIFYMAAELEYFQLPEDTMLFHICVPGMIS